MNNRLSTSITKYSSITGYVILSIIAVIYIIRTNNVIQFEGGDNAYYLFLGKAIVQGAGYRDTFLPGSPPNVHFPPLFPLLIALEIKLFGLNIYLIKLMLSLFAIASLLISPLLLTRYKFKAPFLPAILLGVSYIYFYHCDQFLTEPIFITSVFSSLLFFECFITKDKKSYLILSVVFCWASLLTRTAGLAIAGTLPLAYLLTKEKKAKNITIASVFFVILILPFVLWSLRNKIMAGETSSYLNQFMLIDPYDPSKGKITLYFFVMRILEAIKFYFSDTTENLIYSLYNSPRVFSLGTAGLFWGLFLLGFVRKSITKTTAVELFTLAFVFITLSWPFRGYRFLMPAYLLLFGYTIYGALFIVSSIKQKILSKAILLFFGMLFLGIITINIRDSYNYYVYSQKAKKFKVHVGDGVFVLPEYPEIGRMLEAGLWIKNNTSNDGITLTRKPSLLALAGVKKVIGLEFPIPPEPAKWLYKKRVKYLLIDEAHPDMVNFMRVLTNKQSTIPGIKIIYKNENTYVIEVDLQTLIQHK